MLVGSSLRLHADGEITVDDVQLGLLSIREKNDMEHGLLVPVWFFTGTFRCSEAQRSERSDVQNYDSFNPLLIINAVDGSIIDPWVGY